MTRFDIGENVFWILLWIILAALVAGIASNISDYYSNKNKIQTEAIAKSADPAQTACALKFETIDDRSLCLAAFNKQKGE